MTQTTRYDYKGYAIEVTPHGDYCASFAVDVRDPDGKLLGHLGSGGNFESRAVERGQEWIDIEQALHNAE